jgi:hypothetical protein
MKLAPILVLAISMLFSVGSFARCPTKPMSEDSLTESGIKSYLALYGKQKLTLEDFACCLPSTFLKNYVVAHSSMAAQDSIPESPRVIMTNFEFNDSGVSKPPTAFFSVNGGHHSLRQSKSYELALVDPERGTLNLYDIDFSSGKPVMHGPNPPTCLACHGNNGQASGNGPHLIFDGPTIWPRFVKGLDFLDPIDSRPTPIWLRTYLNRLNAASETALKSNPRFKCLNPNVPTVGFQNELDHMIDKLNRVRVAEEAIQSKDYDKFKYAIAGSLTCPKMTDDIDCQLKGLEAQSNTQRSQCNSWIGTRTLREMIDTSTLAPWVKDAKSKEELDRIALERFNERRADVKNEAETSNRTGALERMQFIFRARMLSERKHLLPENLNHLQSMLLRRFATDSEDQSATLNPTTRFLFESRRIPISSWSTEIVGGYQRQSVGIFELQKREPAGGSLNSVLNKTGDTCENLRLASLNATAPGAASGFSPIQKAPITR